MKHIPSHMREIERKQKLSVKLNKFHRQFLLSFNFFNQHIYYVQQNLVKSWQCHYYTFPIKRQSATHITCYINTKIQDKSKISLSKKMVFTYFYRKPTEQFALWFSHYSLCAVVWLCAYVKKKEWKCGTELPRQWPLLIFF